MNSSQRRKYKRLSRRVDTMWTKLSNTIVGRDRDTAIRKVFKHNRKLWSMEKRS